MKNHHRIERWRTSLGWWEKKYEKREKWFSRSNILQRCFETITLQLYYEVRLMKKIHFSGERQWKSIEFFLIARGFKSLQIFNNFLTVIYDTSSDEQYSLNNWDLSVNIYCIIKKNRYWTHFMKYWVLKKVKLFNRNNWIYKKRKLFVKKYLKKGKTKIEKE